jgi:hypothetical protein
MRMQLLEQQMIQLEKMMMLEDSLASWVGFCPLSAQGPSVYSQIWPFPLLGPVVQNSICHFLGVCGYLTLFSEVKPRWHDTKQI